MDNTDKKILEAYEKVVNESNESNGIVNEASSRLKKQKEQLKKTLQSSKFKDAADIDKIKRYFDKSLYSDEADKGGEWLEDLFGKPEYIRWLIKELEIFAKHEKAEFGKKSDLGAYIANLKAFDSAGRKLIETMDNIYNNNWKIWQLPK